MVGGGDSAIEEALFLARFASKVTVIHRRDSLRASRYMAAKAFENPKIDFLWNSVVKDVLDVEKGEVEGALIQNMKTDEKHVLPVKGEQFFDRHGKLEWFYTRQWRIYGIEQEFNGQQFS